MKKILSALAIAALCLSADAAFAQKSAKTTAPSASLLVGNPAVAGLSKKETKALTKSANDQVSGSFTQNNAELNWSAVCNKADKRITGVMLTATRPQSEAYWNMQKQTLDAAAFTEMEKCLEKSENANCAACMEVVLRKKLR